MAIGRLSVKVGKKGKASKHAQYIFRQGKYEKPTSSMEVLEHTEHGNMPKWAESEPNFFWQMADEHERKNGSTYREHEIALPRELNAIQRLELVRFWIKEVIGDKHAYQFAIHNPTALDGGEQPHVHLMFSDRLIDDIERDPAQYFKRYNSKHPERGGAKKDNTAKLSSQRKQELKDLRLKWEELHNRALKYHGSDKRITMKSYKDLGIRYQPLNIPMHKFNNPKIKQEYKDSLQHKKDFFDAKQQRDKIDIPLELERLNLESQQLSEYEHTISYKALLYIHRDKNCLDPRYHNYEGEIITYDARQVKEIINFRNKNNLNYKDRGQENYYDEYPERVKNFFHDVTNITNDENKRIIKMITEPDAEREQYQQQQQSFDKSDQNSSVAKNRTGNEQQQASTRRFRP